MNAPVFGLSRRKIVYQICSEKIRVLFSGDSSSQMRGNRQFNRIYQIVVPPSITTRLPVMNEDAGDAR